MKRTIRIFTIFLYNRYQFLLICFFISFFHYSSNSQVKISNKDEINITSSFKPSIIKKDRVLLYASPLDPDSTDFKFTYNTYEAKINTQVKVFSISPLDIERTGLNTDSAGFFAKIGYGSIQNPYLNLAFENDNENRMLSIWANHLSGKGMFPDQLFSNSSIGANINSKLNEYQHLTVKVGYDLDHFRRYGFDHDMFNFDKDSINQEYKIFHTQLSFSSLSKNKKSSFSPSLYFSNLSANNISNENQLNLIFPVKTRLTEKFILKTIPSMNVVFLNKTKNYSTSSSLLQLPLTCAYTDDLFIIEGGFNSILWKSGARLLPALDLQYKPLTGNYSLFVEVDNKAYLNSFHNLSKQNPFIVSPDSLSTFQQVDYGVGLKLTFEKRFSFNISGGITTFRNLPLFINAGKSGKDMKVLYQSNLHAFHVKSEFLYSPSLQFDIKGKLVLYSFTGNSKNTKNYGFIPSVFSADFIWKPTPNLKLKSIVNIWKGSWAFSELKSNHLLENVADLNLSINYDLNKKWGIWLDLNNIANVKYERWSQYASFGFNFTGGVRFQLFNKK